MEENKIQVRRVMILDNDLIILKTIKEIKENWNEAFKLMNENGNDKLLLDVVFADEIID